ncbi:hypothetical protein [Egicoccus sp. AB-alg6-2]|uniref:hypothetical protein n=1 Tax=Egicoccus sp. AB-alg6-2 TaxID=3242692 RepID=UPI00359CFEC3
MPPTTPVADVTVAGDPTAALPVLLELTDPVRDRVRSWVEGVLGWQPVDPETDRLVPPRVCLMDPVTAVERGPRVLGGDVPVILLVGEEHPSDIALAAVRVRPVATLRWPEDRDGLADAALGGLQARRPTGGGARVVRVGGAAGGVGTSTVAAALAGLFGWQGERTLTILGPGAPVAEVRDLAAGALSGAGLWAHATPLAGVESARAVRVVGRAPRLAPVVDPAIGVCVVDAGVDDDVDVLVLRADTAGLAAAGRTTAAAVVVIGKGPAPCAAVAEACGPRRRVHLPRSARVARAGLCGRVPAGLPGSWLRPMLPLTRARAGDPP